MLWGVLAGNGSNELVAKRGWFCGLVVFFIYMIFHQVIKKILLD
jgi:hypothetical protein